MLAPVGFPETVLLDLARDPTYDLVIPINWLFSAILTILLAFPAGQVVQLCKHESGPIHVFAGGFCDGTLSHGQHGNDPHSKHRHGHHHDHGHDHSDEHSQHASSGEHHEPCTHETISTGDDLAKAQPLASVAPGLVATLLPIEQWTPSVSAPSNTSLLWEPHTRGPPGLDDPLRRFATCIRLTV
ncbi:hypothetical protein [Pelagicoccus sp. SDUM812002]|uniref:hypothetical protein n=1 Tax=Pelagicoccus sp. SDUM812002 TaxID=3041266 RepID=UPI00280FEF18|nr:hypothetical protein [Pelagicoccus sp. SDUM812002]MDQ8184566.1 hypothetical protein [Pelagicoccus sp. SDUM812002]